MQTSLALSASASYPGEHCSNHISLDSSCCWQLLRFFFFSFLMTLTVLKTTHQVFVESFLTLPEFRHVHFSSHRGEGVIFIMAYPVWVLPTQLSLLRLTSITWLKWHNKHLCYKLQPITIISRIWKNKKGTSKKLIWFFWFQTWKTLLFFSKHRAY